MYRVFAILKIGFTRVKIWTKIYALIITDWIFPLVRMAKQTHLQDGHDHLRRLRRRHCRRWAGGALLRLRAQQESVCAGRHYRVVRQPQCRRLARWPALLSHGKL